MTTLDGHRFWLDLEDGRIYTVRVECPWPTNFVMRSCWPCTEDGRRESAPQDICVYKSWCENVDADELLHGKIVMEIGADVKFEPSGSMELHIARVLRSYVEESESQKIVTSMRAGA